MRLLLKLVAAIIFTGCVQSKPSTFNKGAVSVSKVKQSDLEKIGSSQEAKERMKVLLDKNQIELTELALAQVRSHIGNSDVDYGGYVFYDLEETLTVGIEFMQDKGLGGGLTVREALEEDGYDIESFIKGEIPDDIMETNLENAIVFQERGVEGLIPEDAGASDEYLKLAGGRGAARGGKSSFACATEECQKKMAESREAGKKSMCNTGLRMERSGVYGTAGCGVLAAIGCLVTAEAGCAPGVAMAGAICAGASATVGVSGTAIQDMGGCGYDLRKKGR